MRRIFWGMFAIISAIVLSACGTVVSPEMETATLEVQIVSSENDSTPIEFIRVRGEDGEIVASVRNSVNRLVKFDLPRGDYTVVAQVSKASGSVTMSREVVLSGESEVMLDLTESVPHLWLDSDSADIRVGFLATDESSKFDSSIDLQFSSSLFEMSGAYDTTGVSTTNLQLVSEEEGRMLFEPESELVSSYNLYVSLQNSGAVCGYSVGTYYVTWKGEGIIKFQTLSPTWPCKG